MKRIGISIISTVFAFFAFAICIYGLFFSSENAIRAQAIYWFCVAVVAAAVPYLKDLAPYIKRVKVGDVEVDLNEFKKEVVQTVKNEVKSDVQTVKDELKKDVQTVSNKVEKLDDGMTQLQDVFNTYAKNLAQLKPEDRLPLQEFHTRRHLRNASMTISELKGDLNRLDYYHGPIDDNFSLELAQAIEKFQRENVKGEPDGIAGPFTLSKIRELLS